LQSLYDPEAVEACVTAGTGAEIALDVGGKTDDMHGEPIHIVGTVGVIDDGLTKKPDQLTVATASMTTASVCFSTLLMA